MLSLKLGKAPRRTSSLPPPQPPRSAGATLAAACPFSAHPMRALARAASSLLRRAAGSAPTTGSPHHPSPGVGPCLAKNLPGFFFNGYSTLLAPPSEVLIPPELLSSRTVWTPDRELGQYEDLVARVTNFHNEDKGFMVLDGDVFDVPIRKDIVHRVVRWQLAKRQQGTHSTKTISEVSGTGRKPYKQKGTGRARHGTLRGPQFRGGATMHGPKPRSHAIKLQKKVRRLGLKIALSARTAEGKLLVFEDLEVPSHKTKNIVQYIRQMDDTKKVLLVDGGDIDKKLKLATQNLHYVNVLPSIGLNVYSILQHDTLVMSRAAINRIVERMHTPINR
ncbi:hypothetical protein BDA96_06G063400 [Sorghum bicolor]|uniref:Large ribosomal subunit protein uL4m n=2 Tax=Sorghum bicolor TaxID=4558 RepID=A0A921QS15_SORBI|nr:uncharacterized protein LOC8072011 [Sorghum bicolor]EES10663.1 hypothetical protein SORBI_3006G056600 [Sorghum bicolor]KAG0525516.1 hypothetical protein BDA96_06G063400 [Sorghum bicolor]|eukprot:XP_002446335.1 uncharacterized protein LOC8072011 [Sorghum bicolor]